MSKAINKSSYKIYLRSRQEGVRIPSVRYTIKEFNDEFPDDDACLDHLFYLRFGGMKCCQNCGVVAAQFKPIEGRKSYACVHCRHQLYPMAGTIFHRSRVSLKLWFYAIYLFSVSRNGVSAMELERQLGVTHKTAWRMAKMIRTLMTQGTGFLKGVVEADEAYIGGRRRSNLSRFGNKTPLLGAVQRGGELRVQTIYDSPTARDVTDFIASNVLVGSELQTDESPLYRRAGKVYNRRVVKHKSGVYAKNGTDYTNTIEGFWGIFKPYLDGTHRHVSKQWLHLYVNEAVWKYNHREEQLYPLLLSRVVQHASKGR